MTTDPKVDYPEPDVSSPYALVSRMQELGLEIGMCAEKPLDLVQEVDELLRQYRALAPITSCPPEVLSDIFKAYVTSHWEDYDSYIGHPISHTWLKILHVCRAWREAALATPQLWTRISPTSGEFVRFAASHSGSFPLHFRSTPFDPITRESQIIVRRPFVTSSPLGLLASSREMWFLLPRIRYLDLYVEHLMLEDIQILFPSMQTVVADNLEELDIKYCIPRRALPGMNTVIFPTANLPKLATLRLFCTRDDGRFLRPLLRETLTTLSLTSIYSAMTTCTLVDALRSVPLLQSLHVSNVLMSGNSYASILARNAYTELPHLRTLYLEDRYSGRGLIQLLNQLTIPMDTEVLFRVRYTRGGLHSSFGYFLDKLLSRPTAPGRTLASVTRPQSMIIGLPRIRTIRHSSTSVCYLWADSHPHGFPYVRVRDPSRFGLIYECRTDQINKASLSDVLTYLHTADIVSLGVRSLVRREDWVEAFRASTKVERLFIERSKTAYNFLSAFSEPLPQEPSGDTETGTEEPQPPLLFLFPVLKELEVTTLEPSRDFLLQITACMKRRMQQGMVLERLTFRHAAEFMPEELHLIQSVEGVGRVDIVHAQTARD